MTGFISEEEEMRGREVWIVGVAGKFIGGSIGSFWFLIWRTQLEIGREGSFREYKITSSKRRVISELLQRRELLCGTCETIKD